MQTILIESLRLDGDTQSRAAIYQETVAEYAEAIEAGVTLPPVIVYYDGLNNWLADGFHRVLAAQRIGCKTIECVIRTGTQTDAQMHAYGANQSHGLRRSNADKRKSVEGVLRLNPDWSDRAIAAHVGVSHTMVAAIRSPERADAQADARTKSAGKVESDSTPTIKQEMEAANRSSLPAAEPPSIVAQRAPGLATTTGPEDDSEGGDTDLGEDPADLMAEMDAQIKALEAKVTALSADDGKAQLLNALQRLEHAERRTAELMEASSKQQRRADTYERMLARIGKAVGERDLDKVAPVVEAMARATKRAAA